MKETDPVADPGFPRGGGAPTYYFAIFSQKLHEIEKNWAGGVPHAPRDPPLRPIKFLEAVDKYYLL